MSSRVLSLIGNLWPRKIRPTGAAVFVPARLGIEGLPKEVTEIRPGGLYVVLLPPERETLPLLAGTLAQGLHAGSRMAVCDVAPTSLSHPLSQRLAHVANSELLSRNLALFAYDSTLLEAPANNLWELVRSLESQHLQQTDCLLMMSAERLLPTQSRPALQHQLRVLGEWHAHHKVAGLYVAHGDDALWRELQRQAEWLDGLACLAMDRHRMAWTVPAWRGMGNDIGKGSYPLGARPDGDLYSLGMHQEEAGVMQPVTDEHRVLTCWNPSRFGQSAPVNWDILDTPEELMSEALAGAVGATVILEYHGMDSYETVARQVHQLRLSCGRRLKILVREVDSRINYEQEMQLYFIGATRILRLDMPLSDCFRAISALKGQWFWRPIEPDFDAFLASANTGEGYGYLPPIDFTTTTDEFMRCSQNTHVDSVLVRLTLRSDQHHLAAINAFRPDRPGMFITTDDKHLHLFLFACPASDVDAVMGRIFDQPVSSLFAFYEIIVIQKEIEEELERLRYNTEFAGFTDYSELLKPVASSVH